MNGSWGPTRRVSGPILLAGCATAAPYHGVSSEGLWRLTIADDRITVDYDGHNELVWPRARHRRDAGVRIWQAGGSAGIERVRIESVCA